MPAAGRDVAKGKRWLLPPHRLLSYLKWFLCQHPQEEPRQLQLSSKWFCAPHTGKNGAASRAHFYGLSLGCLEHLLGSAEGREIWPKGAGARGVQRIAGSAQRLWLQILSV